MRALEEGWRSLKAYEEVWRRALWPDFRAMLVLRRLLDAMPDGLIEALVRLADEEVVSRLARGLDMDRQSTILRALPGLLLASFLGPLLKRP